MKPSSSSTVEPPPPTSGKPNVTSCVYQTTELGLISFTWCTNLTGRSLRIHFQSPNHNTESTATACCFDLRIQPLLFWRPNNGSKTFNLINSKTLQICWNFSKAKLTSDHPEPKSGFFVALLLDGVMILLVGDSSNQAHNKNHNHKQQKQVLVLRREHVFAGRFYTTRVRFGGKTRDVSIDCRIGGGDEARLCFGVDGLKVVEIKRLKWKFRGNQRVEIDGKYPVDISWDVYNWLFQSGSSSSSPGGGGAVFMFRFENPFEEEMIGDEKVVSGGKMISCGFGINNFGLKKRSSMSSSSSSSSFTSSSCSCSVMEWADTELDNNNNGFSLLIHAWKS